MNKGLNRESTSKIKWIYLTAITVIAILCITLIGPKDYFYHGYYCDDEIAIELINNHVESYIDLSEEEYLGEFRPMKPRFAGVELFLANQPQGNTGVVCVEISDKEGNTVDTMSADLSKVLENRWWKLYATKDLKKGEIYSLRIYANGCSTYPKLRIMDSTCVASETVKGDLLIGYAYGNATFSISERVLMVALVCVVYLFLVTLGVSNMKCKKQLVTLGILEILVIGMSWQYAFNFLDNQNTAFTYFQADSENLVSSTLVADRDGEWIEGSYGLGRYCNINGAMICYNQNKYITDNNWKEGYNRERPAICIYPNEYTKLRAVVENKIKFSNGEVFDIEEVNNVDDLYLNIYLNSKEVLTSERCGSIDDIVFCDAEGQELPSGIFPTGLYGSQVGLQGKVFRSIGKHLKEENALQILNLLCSILTAIVLMLVVVLVYKKYNALMSGCFFATFLLSPWVVNFAKNLYWVEFTWFLPMLVGLFCALKINSRKCRILSYILVFVSICLKCLCGYEYISTIMMGTIAFLLADFFVAIHKKDMNKGALLFRTICITGIVALLGFIFAICFHAVYRGGGNITDGIRDIINNDVLRRTYGADLNVFIDIQQVADSLDASTWEVLCQYFSFNTEIMTGISGNLFPVLCLVPLVIFVFEYRNKQTDVENVSLYSVFFLTTVSWFILAKAHSYVHTHMNYVLWYFGFVQICIYIIIRKAAQMIKNAIRSGE